jgi:hypothetical protein
LEAAELDNGRKKRGKKERRGQDGWVETRRRSEQPVNAPETFDDEREMEEMSEERRGRESEGGREKEDGELITQRWWFAVTEGKLPH